MPVDEDLIEDITARLAPLGPIVAKRMFGGVGLMHGGRMFAMITGAGLLAFKADDRNREEFVEAGMIKVGKMPYYEATAEQLEDDTLLLEVARSAVAAALR